MRQEERTHGHASPPRSPPVTPGLQSGSARAWLAGPAGGCSKAVPAALSPAREEEQGNEEQREEQGMSPEARARHRYPHRLGDVGFRV